MPERFTREHPLGTWDDAKRAEHAEMYPEQAALLGADREPADAREAVVQHWADKLRADGITTFRIRQAVMAGDEAAIERAYARLQDKDAAYGYEHSTPLRNRQAFFTWALREERDGR